MSPSAISLDIRKCKIAVDVKSEKASTGNFDEYFVASLKINSGISSDLRRFNAQFTSLELLRDIFTYMIVNKIVLVTFSGVIILHDIEWIHELLFSRTPLSKRIQMVCWCYYNDWHAEATADGAHYPKHSMALTPCLSAVLVAHLTGGRKGIVWDSRALRGTLLPTKINETGSEINAWASNHIHIKGGV